MKKFLAILSSVILILSIFTACSENSQEVDAVTQTTKATTTETTTVRTTEDLSTTFKEVETAKIYPALKKDTSDKYSYKLSTYKTAYQSSNKTRTVNIQNAVKRLNNLVIPDGETFSFNQVVGKRTVLAGYEEAKVVQGDEFVDGLGGGICQVSSTIFQAALRANLDITVRACHSLEISYVPLGSDATVQWNSQDFQFKNNSGSDIKLKVTAENGTLVCSIYAVKDVTVGIVKVKIEKNSDDSYTLIRTVNGKENYSTYSKYKKAKVTTTKKDKDKSTTKKKS
ncbi:MAG: VanW family protein [Acetobacter sp.]|nr:VanW family protein [Bacteroides sp.]MCM1341804.1 VanW family protein [Acetobacter sp.]MCM1433970.1 VanW family protein [Clostridiales bacterium]